MKKIWLCLAILMIIGLLYSLLGIIMSASLGGIGGFSLQTAQLNFYIYLILFVLFSILLVICICGYLGVRQRRSANKKGVISKELTEKGANDIDTIGGHHT